MLVAPKYDLTDDELAVLERYWNRPRAAMLVLLDPGETPAETARLPPRQRRHAAPRPGDRPMTDKRSSPPPAAFFTEGVDFTKDLAGQATEFGGASSSLEVREGAEDLLNRQINPIGLIQVAAGFLGRNEIRREATKPSTKRRTTRRRSIWPPASPAAPQPTTASPPTPRAWWSSPTPTSSIPSHHRAENLDFLASSVNWLVGRESLAGIGPRSLGTYKLPLLDAQVSFINRVNLFFLPAFLLLIGAFVWSSRRA